MDIYVGNVPETATADDLQALLGHHARHLEVRMITVQAADGAPHRFGVLSTGSRWRARWVIRRLSARRLRGRRLCLREYVHRTYGNEQRALEWRRRAWSGPERRGSERRRARPVAEERARPPVAVGFLPSLL